MRGKQHVGLPDLFDQNNAIKVVHEFINLNSQHCLNLMTWQIKAYPEKKEEPKS